MFSKTCMRCTGVRCVWLTPAEDLGSLPIRSACFTRFRTTGTDGLKGPEKIGLKSCQETEGKTEGSLFHVGIAGEDCFLTWFMKTNICEIE